MPSSVIIYNLHASMFNSKQCFIIAGPIVVFQANKRSCATGRCHRTALAIFATSVCKYLNRFYARKMFINTTYVVGF